jgi:class 3 adenylate cyclase/predicted ATPase
MPDDISNWLAQLGLRQYASMFDHNDIVVELLPRLTNADLKEIGITSLGHRKTILEAIETLDPAILAVDDSFHLTGEAERRQLTVMFCDLADSTKLSQQLDPEDLRQIKLVYQDACKQIIERYGGYLARYMGDGILAYFGYPQAHEDDAERAVHAGLGIVLEAPKIVEVTDVQVGHELAVRIGIETGPVVVGDLIGEAASQESAVVGETPNVAARLQSLAPRNTVVVGPGTQSLVKSRFEFDDLGDHRLKGIEQPIRVWQIIAGLEADSRFELDHRSSLTPLVGREHEIGLMLDRWHQATDGDGQVVLLSGEAGIGKSRITAALRANLSQNNIVCLSYQCSPHHSNSAFYPVIEQIKRAAQFAPDDTQDEKLDKLDDLLGSSGSENYLTVSLHAFLLSLPTDERHALPLMSPERQKDQVLGMLTSRLESLSLRQPVLLIFEDIHWADPSSLELLDLIVAKVQQISALAVITFRPEYMPRWGNHTHITSLTLNRFTRRLASAMVDGISAGKPLPDEIRQQIIDKTDGMPLFVEELTKSILESGLLSEESNRFTLSESISDIAIPATLQDSLMARLDRLALGKPIAQIGAVVGRVFSRRLLEIVCDLETTELDQALGELIESGLVYGTGENFTFKHALVQEAAYASLLKARRRELHMRIAEAIRTSFEEIAELQPEILAHHYSQGEQYDSALEYWLLAGQRAQERSADQEAVGHLTSGIAILRGLPETTANECLELDYLLALCGPAIIATGWGSQLSADTYTRARELCTRLDESTKIYPVVYGEYMLELTRGRMEGTRKKAFELLELGKLHQDVEALMTGHRTVAWSSLYLGDFTHSRRHVDEVLALYQPEVHKDLKFRYAHDPRVAALCTRAILEMLFGDPAQSIETAAETLEFAREIDHASTLTYALMFAGALPAVILKDVRRAGTFTDEILQLSRQIRSDFWLGFGHVISGWSHGIGGDYEGGLEQLQEGLRLLDGSAPHPWRPLFLALAAELQLQSGDQDWAIGTLESAWQMIERTGERMWETGVHLQLGKTLLQQRPDNTVEAENRLSHALETAERQEAILLQLRAANCLGELWLRQGRHENARHLVESALARHTSQFDTPDLAKAREILNQMNS